MLGKKISRMLVVHVQFFGMPIVRKLQIDCILVHRLFIFNASIKSAESQSTSIGDPRGKSGIREGAQRKQSESLETNLSRLTASRRRRSCSLCLWRSRSAAAFSWPADWPGLLLSVSTTSLTTSAALEGVVWADWGAWWAAGDSVDVFRDLSIASSSSFSRRRSFSWRCNRSRSCRSLSRRRWSCCSISARCWEWDHSRFRESSANVFRGEKFSRTTSSTLSTSFEASMIYRNEGMMHCKMEIWGKSTKNANAMNLVDKVEVGMSELSADNAGYPQTTLWQNLS